MTPFRNRTEAGRILAGELGQYAHRPDVIVLALPRGGVPVGEAVAGELGVELDVFVVRKLGAPGREELAMGAIAAGGARVLNEQVVSELGVDETRVERTVQREREELERRVRMYRGDAPPPTLRDRICILVDDGLATGASMRAAVSALRQSEPQKVVMAVPVAAADVCRSFEGEVDQVLCAATPEPFLAVGRWYEDFAQTTDEQVREILARRGR